MTDAIGVTIESDEDDIAQTFSEDREVTHCTVRFPASSVHIARDAKRNVTKPYNRRTHNLPPRADSDGAAMNGCRDAHT
ncbi:hypothetical protein PAQ31011_02939 [Pandoraea aquatica]|uniref:Uncharacterized protein n=1 Tax=Pandoraea aquatica TaxID=2508290 RepID=A0A5E4VY23_9BURK|nr:hypothetical protein [Pandoraea aquatica]VVE16773.1 hypothetical protein PAQ31011_02939 [Pandoraea aquatica]